jgi:hypothetical protein
MPLGGEGWPAAEMLEKPWNVKKSKRPQTLNGQNKANPSQQLCNLWHSLARFAPLRQFRLRVTVLLPTTGGEPGVARH